MATFAVYHMIHVRTPHQHIPKLVVSDVPEGEELSEELLERAGYQFGEFNIPWANHVLTEVDVKESPSDLVARIRSGDGERIAWGDLVAQAEAPL